MAKKEPTIEDAAAHFVEVMDRCRFVEFKRINNILYSTNKNNKHTIIIPDHSLWDAVLEYTDFIEKVREFNITIPADKLKLEQTKFARDMDNGWIEIDTEKMMNDDRVYIKVTNKDFNDFTYSIEINKTIWPTRFKKDEINNFEYKIFGSPYFAFGVRKKFEGCVEDSSFYIMRVFRII